MNYPNSFGGVSLNGNQPSFSSKVYGTSGHTQTVTTIEGVVHVVVGCGCVTEKPTPKAAP